MFDIGQRVICIRDTCDPRTRRLYEQFPVKGVVYVIRDWRIGIGNDGQTGAISVLLNGLTNPKAESNMNLERGFDSDRFEAI